MYSLSDNSVHPRRVGLRHFLAGQGRGLDDEVIEGQLGALAHEQRIELLAQFGHSVHLDVKRQVVVGHRLLALHQPLGNHGPHARNVPLREGGRGNGGGVGWGGRSHPRKLFHIRSLDDIAYVTPLARSCCYGLGKGILC